MRAKTSAKAPSQRQQRVAEEIRTILSDVLLRGDFSRRGLNIGLVTITQVHTPPDLKNAKVFIIPLGGGDATEILSHLNQMASEIRYCMAKNLVTKYTSALKFYGYDTFEQISHIDSLTTTAQNRDKMIDHDANS